MILGGLDKMCVVGVAIPFLCLSLLFNLMQFPESDATCGSYGIYGVFYKWCLPKYVNPLYMKGNSMRN